MKKQNFFYRKEGALQKINLDEIVFLEADNNYTKFFTINGGFQHIIRTSLDAILSRSPENGFLRIHRSYAVSAEYIDKVEREVITLATEPKIQLPVSKKHYADFVKQLVIFDSAPTGSKYQQK